MCRKTPISAQSDGRNFPGKTSNTEVHRRLAISFHTFNPYPLWRHCPLFSLLEFEAKQTRGQKPTC